MAGYEKFTLKSFQEKLAGGGYDSLAGVNRAIGRMSTWSEEECDKARKLALAHFGEAAPAKTKKTQKAASPKTPFVRKKKTGKKVSATKGKKKERAVAAPPAPQAKTKGKKASAKKAPKKPAAPRATQAAPRVQDPIEQANRIGDSIHHRLESLDLARRLGAPSEEIAVSARRAQVALTQVIDALGSSVSNLIGGLSEEERRGAAAFEKAALATGAAGGNGLKSSPTAAPPMPPVYPPQAEQG